jgi:hypothetical protein
MSVLIFSTSVSTIRHLRRVQRYITVMYTGIRVRYSLFLVDLTDT